MTAVKRVVFGLTVLAAITTTAVPVAAQYRIYAPYEHGPSSTTTPADGNVYVFAPQGTSLARAAMIPVGTEHNSSVVISPDRTRGYLSRVNDIAMIDLLTGAVTSWTAVDAPGALAVTSDGQRLMVGSRTAAGITVLNAATGQVIKTLPVAHLVDSIRATPNGEWLVATYSPFSATGQVSVVHLPTDEVAVHSVAGVAGDAVVSPDGSQVFVRTRQTVGVYDRQTWQLVQTIQVASYVPSSDLALSSDGAQLYVGFARPDTNIAISDLYRYDTQLQTLTVALPYGIGDLRWSHDGRYLLSLFHNEATHPSSIRNVVRVFDAQTETWTTFDGIEAPGTLILNLSHGWAIATDPVCDLTVIPTGAVHRQSGGTTVVDVQGPPACQWSATSHASWLTASPASGAGNGTVTISVAPGIARTSRVTIGGTDVTIKQAWSQGHIDSPASGGTYSQPATLSGWMFDKADEVNDTGISSIQVWAYPRFAASPTFMGNATRVNRSDIGQIYGITSAGFTMRIEGLAPGEYDLVAYGHSRHDGSFTPYATHVTLGGPPPPDIAMAVDSVPAGASMPQPLVITGWAIDKAAPTGVGVDAVHVWAFPVGGGSPTFVGPATIGLDRDNSDIRNMFGHQFSTPGFAILADNLPAGTYDIVAYAHSSRTGQFEGQYPVRVTLQGTMEPGSVWVRSQSGSTFSLEGYVLDRRASSGCGMDWVHLYAYPASGAPIFLGHVTPCASDESPRPELVPLFGTDKARSRWRMLNLSLPQGTYTIVAYGRSAVTGQFDNVRTITIVIGGS